MISQEKKLSKEEKEFVKLAKIVVNFKKIMSKKERLYHIAILVTDRRMENFGKMRVISAYPEPLKRARRLLRVLSFPNYRWRHMLLIPADLDENAYQKLADDLLIKR